ncbi:MAG: Ig-like domain-containing protein, partial [Thiohalomonadales bacterium]
MLFSSFRYGQYIIIALLFSLLNACGGGGNNLPETAPKDTIPPKIELIKPIPGSKVTTNSFVEITFNEEIQNYDTNNIQIRTYKNNIVDPNSTIALKTSDLSFSQKTLIVKPGILQSDKKYQVIVKEFRDIAGNMLKEQCQWDFATENYPGTINNTITGNCGNGPGTPDTTPPLIVNVNPATTSTPTTSSIIITFSEAIDTSTLDSNITLSEISANGTALLVTPMPYTLDNYNSTEFKVTLIPTFSPALKANTQYQITIKAGPTGIKDIQGNSLVTDSNTRFTTLANTVSDTTPPQVSGITPISDATVDPATNITVNFNEAMAPSTIQANITLSQIVNGSPISVKPLSNLFTYDYNNISNKATLTIVSGQFLAYQSQYEIRVTTGIKDKSGNALTADIKSLFFTTQQPDSTAPTILKVTPATGTNIAPTTNITITFSEKMDSTTLKPNIKLVSVNDIAATPLNNYSYNYNVTTKIVTFTPIQIPALLYGTKYQLLIKSGINGVKDISNNSLATNYTRNFTTSLAPDKTAPTVINVIPTEGSTVAASTDIKIYFSENMKETSLQTNFELYEVVTGSPSLITPFPFIVQYNQVDFIATLLPNPTIPTLLPGKNYRIIVKGSPNGVMDIAGNQLSADKPTNFSTAVASNQWSWIEGSNTGNAVGDYVLPNQSPGAREHAVTWTDLNGNFWLFGGLTVTPGSLEIFNDLWKFDGANW